jgi:hypothetical protein
MTFPGTAPAKRVHVPPPPSGTRPDPGGRTKAERVYRQQQQAADLYTRWKDSFPDGIAPDELADNAGQFAYTDAALALPDAVAAVQAEADDADKRVNDVVSAQKVDSSDVAAQLAAQRFWSRTQRTLDAIKDTSKLAAAARDLIANADDSAVPVIVEEIEPYLEARNVPTSWLTDALSGRIPGLADAKADQIIKQRQLAMVKDNYGRLMNAFQKDLAAPYLHDPTTATAEAYRNGEPYDRSGQ